MWVQLYHTAFFDPVCAARRTNGWCAVTALGPAKLLRGRLLTPHRPGAGRSQGVGASRYGRTVPFPGASPFPRFPVSLVSLLFSPSLPSQPPSQNCILTGVLLTDPYYSRWNFYGDNPYASAHVINSWKGSIVFSGSELGAPVPSGSRLISDGPGSDPVRAAYIYYTYNTTRASWDPLTVLYAMEGLGDLFQYANEHGYNHIAEDGSNEWIFDEKVRNQHWLKLAVSNEAASDRLEQLYLKGAWEAVRALGRRARMINQGCIMSYEVVFLSLLI